MIEKLASFAQGVLATLFGTAIGLVIGAFVALVFWSYWGWFMAPIGAPQISFFHSWGLVVMVGLVVPAPQLVGSGEEQAAYSGRILVSLGIAWPFGYLLHLMM